MTQYSPIRMRCHFQREVQPPVAPSIDAGLVIKLHRKNFELFAVVAAVAYFKISDTETPPRIRQQRGMLREERCLAKFTNAKMTFKPLNYNYF